MHSDRNGNISEARGDRPPAWCLTRNGAKDHTSVTYPYPGDGC
jgi:hypothetical protein